MIYSRTNPFKSRLRERYPLCKPGSQKDTQHLVFSIDSTLTYDVGDSLGIFPENHPEMVEKTLDALKMSGNERIEDKKTKESLTLSDYLLNRASITNFSRKLLLTVLEKEGKKADEPKALHEKYHVWDLLDEHKGAEFTPQEIADLLMPLLPRFYSIASSRHFHPHEIHLTVAHLKYHSNEKPRYGVCTNFLCDWSENDLSSVPVFIQPGRHFQLPEDHRTPIIMIGPGTGVAPFRAFMQERKESDSKNWLFFGERTRSFDYLYENEWENLRKQGKLDIDLAFSRDQADKVYVQHKMIEKGEILFRWLEEGAVLYVCGDAQNMAKDVDKALHDIIAAHGGSSHEPKEYIKNLKHSNRYLRDVY